MQPVLLRNVVAKSLEKPFSHDGPRQRRRSERRKANPKPPHSVCPQRTFYPTRAKTSCISHNAERSLHSSLREVFPLPSPTRCRHITSHSVEQKGHFSIARIKLSDLRTPLRVSSRGGVSQENVLSCPKQEVLNGRYQRRN